MDTRRDFLRKAMLLSGAAGWNGAFPESIRKAMAIDPAPGSTYLDAEHVVILMQENRSFDHCFGTLKGVRGFNDPRAVRQPNQNRVWLQTNEAGETYVPFRFDIHDTKITWMGSIPHVRSSQVDAFNQGKYDQWLNAKRSHNPQFAKMPLTLGYYTREDLPFNYALADAFTVCDQNFSAGMTSTWPNRLFLWTGKIRAEQNGDTKAYIRNDVETGEISWTTFPELLEKAGVPWRVYQNDLTIGGGFIGDERAWLANFGCNLLEPFAQYHVRYSARYVQGLQKQVDDLPGEIAALRQQANRLPGNSGELKKNAEDIAKKEKVLQEAKEGLVKWSQEHFDQLSQQEKNLYHKAFTINDGDPDYHHLDSLQYEEGGESRKLSVPKGDVLHQFRQDVNSGQLPAVSWLVGPENFSDHPTAPWYGAWYVSEVLDILAKNPEVWKKTIFILTYDENDGYFDHVPPFVAPDPQRPETGKCSAGIDTTVEFIRKEQELQLGVAKKEAREAPAGLGFRVPMVVASPWSRGGRVNSQVFDHTSVFRFVQEFLNKKLGKQIEENNVSLWRKTVSGDLTSVFRPYNGEGPDPLPWLQLQPFLQGIYNAKFRKEPANFKALTAEEIGLINRDPFSSPHMAQQEPGIKVSCALPYELYADGGLSDDKKDFVIKMEAGRDVFGERSAGSPFNIQLPGGFAGGERGSRSYAVRAGDQVTDRFPLSGFENGLYHLSVYGPNGFLREYKGSEQDPRLQIQCGYVRNSANRRKLTGSLALMVVNKDPHRKVVLTIRDYSYKNPLIRKELPVSTAVVTITLNTEKSYGWYDLGISAEGFEDYERRYCGRVETGQDSYTDPYMGRVL